MAQRCTHLTLGGSRCQMLACNNDELCFHHHARLQRMKRKAYTPPSWRTTPLFNYYYPEDYETIRDNLHELRRAASHQAIDQRTLVALVKATECDIKILDRMYKLDDRIKAVKEDIRHFRSDDQDNLFAVDSPTTTGVPCDPEQTTAPDPTPAIPDPSPEPGADLPHQPAEPAPATADHAPEIADQAPATPDPTPETIAEPPTQPAPESQDATPPADPAMFTTDPAIFTTDPAALPLDPPKLPPAIEPATASPEDPSGILPSVAAVEDTTQPQPNQTHMQDSTVTPFNATHTTQAKYNPNPINHLYFSKQATPTHPAPISANRSTPTTSAPGARQWAPGKPPLIRKGQASLVPSP